MKTIEQTAVETLRCALTWEPDARLVGDVCAKDLATLAAFHIDTCPKCGATAWVNIDCDLCGVAAALLGNDFEAPTVSSADGHGALLTWANGALTGRKVEAWAAGAASDPDGVTFEIPPDFEPLDYPGARRAK